MKNTKEKFLQAGCNVKILRSWINALKVQKIDFHTYSQEGMGVQKGPKYADVKLEQPLTRGP